VGEATNFNQIKKGTLDQEKFGDEEQSDRTPAFTIAKPPKL
jgi:hypothetical protein